MAKRGRPVTFGPAQRSELAAMIRQHGIRETQRRVAFPICLRTLVRIAREEHIVLPKGRRPRSAR